MASVASWSVIRVAKLILSRDNFRGIYFRCALCLHHSHQKFDNLTSEFSHNNELVKSCEGNFSNLSRYLPRTHSEFFKQQYQKFQQPQNPRLLFVAILGSPNAGKSTLTNSLVKWRVCSVSKKVHTTRNKTAAVLIEGNSQIIFMDTPGLVTPEHSKRHNLETRMVTDPEQSLLKADLIAVVVDVSNKWTRICLDPLVLKLLDQYSNKQSILILNKVDLVKSKRLLLEITHKLTAGIVDKQRIAKIMEKQPNEELSLKRLFSKTEMKMKVLNYENPHTDHEANQDKGGWPHFSKVFMLSALEGNGVNDVRNYMVQMARPSKWIYHGSVITSQKPHIIGMQAIRGKLLDCLPQEIPYTLDLEIEMWQLDDAGVLRIAVNIICPKINYMKLIIGPQGRIISRISDEARQELSNIFHCDISLKLIVKSNHINLKTPQKKKVVKNKSQTDCSDDDDDDE